MKVGNVLVWRDKQFQHPRYWEVVGIFLGAEDQESLIEMRTLSQYPGFVSTTSTTLETVFVPEVLTRNLEVVDNIESMFIGRVS